VPVIAGSGSNSTQEAIELSRHAEEAGAHEKGSIRVRDLLQFGRLCGHGYMMTCANSSAMAGSDG